MTRKIVFKRDGSVTVNGHKVGSWEALRTHWIFSDGARTRSAPSRYELEKLI